MPRLSKAGSTVSGPSIRAGTVARHHRRQADRADEQRADHGGEGQIDEMRSALPQARGRAGEAARAEGALVQALDGLGIDGLLGADLERELSHERTQAIDGKQKWRLERSQPCRRRKVRIMLMGLGVSSMNLGHSSVGNAAQIPSHQFWDGFCPWRISARRLRVATVVPSGSRSRGKNPASAISRSGRLTSSTVKRRIT